MSRGFHGLQGSRVRGTVEAQLLGIRVIAGLGLT